MQIAAMPRFGIPGATTFSGRPVMFRSGAHIPSSDTIRFGSADYTETTANALSESQKTIEELGDYNSENAKKLADETRKLLEHHRALSRQCDREFVVFSNMTGIGQGLRDTLETLEKGRVFKGKKYDEAKPSVQETVESLSAINAAIPVVADQNRQVAQRVRLDKAAISVDMGYPAVNNALHYFRENLDRLNALNPRLGLVLYPTSRTVEQEIFTIVASYRTKVPVLAFTAEMTVDGKPLEGGAKISRSLENGGWESLDGFLNRALSYVESAQYQWGWPSADKA